MARDKLHMLCWDILKEDILVWCVTYQPFRAQQQPILNWPTTTTAGTTPLPASPQQGVSTTQSEPPTLQIWISAGSSTLVSAAREKTASLPRSAGLQAVVETIPPRPAHVLQQWPRELQQAHITLRRSNFQHELYLHLDKAWVTWLNGIDN